MQAIIISLCIYLAIIILAFTVYYVKFMRSAPKPIKVADIKVKVSTSGFGVVYHKLDCKKCKNGHEMPLMLVIANGCLPCVTCGGH